MRRSHRGSQVSGGIDSNRLEAFSDGVMAVIITIMAFDLRAPHGVDFAALRHQLPPLLVYILSFVFVGIYWNNHHHLLRATHRIGPEVMWANLHLLFWLSLVPVATEWVGLDYRHSWPAAIYGVVAAGAAFAYFVLVQCILRTNRDDKALAAAIGPDFKGGASLAIYLVAIGLSFVNPWIGYTLYATVSVIWFIPDRRLAV